EKGGHRYRVVKRLRWIEGGKPAPGGDGWEGGRSVTYEPGDTIYLEDEDLSGVYWYVAPTDDIGRTALEEARAEAEKPPEFVASLAPEQCNFLAWELAFKKIRQGEDLRKSLAWAIRNGADLPEDPEFRAWFADAIEGKHDPERGKGRPRKLERWDMIRAAVELGIAECYRKWHAAFEDDPELAWLRAQALRLRQKQPDAEAWRRI